MPSCGGIALVMVGVGGGESPLYAAERDLLPAGMVKVEVKEGAGAQLQL